MAAFPEKVRPTTWRAMTVALAAYAAGLLLSNVTHEGPVGRVLGELASATDGWITDHLVLPLITLAVVAPAVVGFGGLRVADVGWRASTVLPAAAVTLLFWAAMQGSLWLVLVLGGHEPEWDWRLQDDKSAILAALMVQLAGNALVEETFFRGYMLPQVFLGVSRVWSRHAAWAVALLVSLGLFVLSHLPRLLVETESHAELGDELFWVLGFGSILTLAFLVTKNLFVCVGLHSLWNACPMLIEASRGDVERAWWALTAVLIAGWWLVDSSAGLGPWSRSSAWRCRRR